MPDYLLPCTCGKKSVVSTARAGETIHCDCGAELHVPTMRELGQLELADAAAGGRSSRPRSWEDHHRTAFLLVLASLACLGVAGYLWFTLPPRTFEIVEVSDQEIAEAFDNATSVDVLKFYQEQVKYVLLDPPIDPNARPRQMMLWGAGLATAAAAAMAGVAALVGLRGGGRRR